MNPGTTNVYQVVSESELEFEFELELEFELVLELELGFEFVVAILSSCFISSFNRLEFAIALWFVLLDPVELSPFSGLCLL